MLEIQTYENKNLKTSIILATVSLIMICIGIVLSISFGSMKIPFETIAESIFNYDNQNSIHIIIRESRVPRTIGALCIGSALAVAGAIMQGVTRNPIADTGILGISAGATFALSIIICFFPFVSFKTTVIASMCGSAISSVFVYILGSSNKGSNVARLAIAGVTLSGLLTSLSQALAMSKSSMQDLAFWTLGSVSTITNAKLKIIVPSIFISLIIAIVMSKKITIISMGEEVAIGLGVRINQVKLIVLVLVVVLAGVSVALAGMISFVGLIIPHIVRHYVGPDYKYIIPLSAIMGGLLLVYSDILSRTIVPGTEIPIGAIIAIIGVPTFLYIAKNNKGVGA